MSGLAIRVGGSSTCATMSCLPVALETVRAGVVELRAGVAGR